MISTSLLISSYIAGLNDLWRSLNKGSSWSLVTSSASWSGRYSHSSVALDSNTIVLMGGSDNNSKLYSLWIFPFFIMLSHNEKSRIEASRMRERVKEIKGLFTHTGISFYCAAFSITVHDVINTWAWLSCFLLASWWYNV